ncbi:MAG TPA: serine hydrolase [Balneolales bacterium]|nr:serine hydrolase [Balneolales bacterium]
MKTKKLIYLALFLLLTTSCSSTNAFKRSNSYTPKSHQKVIKQIQKLFYNFHGKAGLYVHNLATGETFAINADSLYPTASMIKVPIMVTLFNEMNEGKYTYNQQFVYDGKHDYPYDKDIINSEKIGTKVPLSQLIMLMISMSNNSAALWCQSIAGGGLAINHWLSTHGYKVLRMNSRTPGREQAYKKYGWGVTSPRELAELVTQIFKGKVVSKAASEEMYRTMSRSFWDGEAMSQIPYWVNVASKQGAVDQARSEVDFVNAPHGNYIFCIATKDQQDTSWTYNNAGYVLIRNVSKVLWQHFEPQSKYKFNPGRKKYW